MLCSFAIAHCLTDGWRLRKLHLGGDWIFVELDREAKEELTDRAQEHSQNMIESTQRDWLLRSD